MVNNKRRPRKNVGKHVSAKPNPATSIQRCVIGSNYVSIFRSELLDDENENLVDSPFFTFKKGKKPVRHDVSKIRLMLIQNYRRKTSKKKDENLVDDAFIARQIKETLAKLSKDGDKLVKTISLDSTQSASNNGSNSNS